MFAHNINSRIQNTAAVRCQQTSSFLPIQKTLSPKILKPIFPTHLNTHNKLLKKSHIQYAVAEEKQQEKTENSEGGSEGGDSEHPQEIRRCLVSLGWDNAWIDGILQQMQKGRIYTTVQKCRAAVEYLESVGLAKYMVQNMVSINHRIVSKDVETELKPIVEYIKKRGMAEPAKILYLYPQLFDFRVGGDGKVLEKDERGRCQVDVFEGGKYLVNFWRHGAAFKTAPISPYQPKDK